jgi:hypothetical protein
MENSGTRNTATDIVVPIITEFIIMNNPIRRQAERPMASPNMLMIEKTLPLLTCRIAVLMVSLVMVSKFLVKLYEMP